MSVKSPIAFVGLASATSAQDAARNGAALPVAQTEPGSLVAVVSATIVTGSVVATFKLQGSFDASTYYDLKSAENPAAVAFSATGTAALCAPHAAACFKFFRVVATLSGAATAGGDLTAVTYYYAKHGGWRA